MVTWLLTTPGTAFQVVAGKASADSSVKPTASAGQLSVSCLPVSEN